MAATACCGWALRGATANQAAAPTGLGLPHANALSTVRAGQARSQRELSSAMGIDKSTMVRIVDYLERQHLLERRRAPADRRAHEIVITEEGERRLRDAEELFRMRCPSCWSR